MTNLPNKDSIERAAHVLRQEAVHQLGFDGIRSYQKKYKEISDGYATSDLNIYSSIRMDKFPPFQEWLPDLIKDKDKIMPILVHNMLQGDIYAENIYRIIQQNTNGSHLILGYDELYANKQLYDVFTDLGASHTSLTVLNAERWLTSQEAANIVKYADTRDDSQVSTHNLCTVNDILGISNSYIDCSSE